MSLLDRINSPDDLRKLTTDQLTALAGDIRKRIIDVISQRGGHLASSLGVVELTVALHRVFATPVDKIVWDVGHQAYAHKILTGRNGQFDTIRQLGGLSGFPSRKESEHDSFGAGHASTSISAALGLATARDVRGEDYAVVAVIGDGAMTGGLAFEGLNNAGNRDTDLIVVLNDNSMSISSNVGAVATYLSRLRTDPTYSKVKAEINSLLRKLPVIGDQVQRTVERVKDSLKYLVLPGMLFEELGFTYLGPIDGHNIRELQSVLTRARSIGGPVLVHVLTTKGKGFRPAEQQPARFHGTGPFEPESGEPVSSGGDPSYSDLFGQALIECADRDNRIVAITAAMPDGTGLTEFGRRFPDRLFDVGIAEAHAVTFAAGLAAAGMRPVVAIYSTFLQRAFDQLAHDVCIQKLPIVFAVDRAGIVGEDGITHHGTFDLSYLRCLPEMVVGAPACGAELRDMLVTAFSLDRPVAIRYPRGRTRWWSDPKARLIPPPAAEELASGRDMALIACGTMVDTAIKTRGLLAACGVSCAVINMRWIKPMDVDAVRRIAVRVGLIVTLEENTVIGGLGSAVLEAVAASRQCVPVRCLGIDDCGVEHGARSEVLAVHQLSPQHVADRIKQYLDEQSIGCGGRQRKSHSSPL